MPQGRYVVLACDESGAKGYANNDEAWPGEVGVFAGILIPQQEREAEARPKFQAIYDRYKPPSGKLHIADLSQGDQQFLRNDVFTAVRELGLPCFWYAIHVAGLHDWYKAQKALLNSAREEAKVARKAPPVVKRGSPRQYVPSMHVELFKGLYGHLVAFLAERDCIETEVEIRTDQVDSPLVKEFEHVAKRLISEDPVLKKVTGWNTITEQVVEGTIEVSVEYPPEFRFEGTIKSLIINTISKEDVYVLAADVLANSLNYMFKNRSQNELYRPLNRPSAVERHPLADVLNTFFDWGSGDLVGDRLYSHPAGRPATLE
jgi:hypothetical protein